MLPFAARQVEGVEVVDAAVRRVVVEACPRAHAFVMRMARRVRACARVIAPRLITHAGTRALEYAVMATLYSSPE